MTRCLLCVLLSGLAVVTGCGAKKDKDKVGDKPSAGSANEPAATPGSAAAAPTAPKDKPAPAAGDPERAKLTDAFAACKEKNTNCAAYAPLETYLKAAKDDKLKKANFDAMMDCVDAGPAGRIEACAYAAWAFTGYAYEAPKDAAYGRRLLASLKTLKTDEESYAGSSVGQFLASWLTTKDASLRGELAVALANKKLETRGRGELFRLCNAECVDSPELFGSVLATAQEATEGEAMRIAAMGALSWSKDDMHRRVIEQYFIATLADAGTPPKIATAALKNLADLGSIDGYPKAIEAIKAHQKDEAWVSAGATALASYFRKPLAIDHKTGVDVALAILADDKVSAWNRRYYLQALAHANDKRVDGALAKAAKDKDASVAKAASDAIAVRKKAAEAAAKKPK